MTVSSHPVDALGLEAIPLAGLEGFDDVRLMGATSLEERGFVLYVGIGESELARAGLSLARFVTALREAVGDVAPPAEIYASVALAAAGRGGRDLDVVRLALGDPTMPQPASSDDLSPDDDAGLLVDLSRSRVARDGESVSLSFQELELLRFLIENEGRTVTREDVCAALWPGLRRAGASLRLVDVHVRRLRRHLGDYADLIRAVRGAGYQFIRTDDVRVRFPSPRPPDRS